MEDTPNQEANKKCQEKKRAQVIHGYTRLDMPHVGTSPEK